MPKAQQGPEADAAPAIPEKRAIPASARPIKDAPLDGRTVWLYNEQITHGIRGKWRKSRHYKQQRWVVNNYWADPTTSKPLAATWTHWLPE